MPIPKTIAQNRATLANLDNDVARSPLGNRRTESAPSAPQQAAAPNAALTAVLSRAFSGPKWGRGPIDPAPVEPPAKPITLDYPPISTQPEYAAEAEKLNRFAGQLEAATAKLAALQEQIKPKQILPAEADGDRIAKAESLLAGNDDQQDLHAEIRKTNKLIDALRLAIDAQHGVLQRVISELTRAAGPKVAEEHQKRVKRMMDALVELHAANQAEIDFHHDLTRLGYSGAVPAMRLHTVEDPFDTNGNIAYYWLKEAKRYVMTPEQVANGVRKSRLAKLMGEG